MHARQPEIAIGRPSTASKMLVEFVAWTSGAIAGFLVWAFVVAAMALL